jgi:hypothetical protein
MQDKKEILKSLFLLMKFAYNVLQNAKVFHFKNKLQVILQQ